MTENENSVNPNFNKYSSELESRYHLAYSIFLSQTDPNVADLDHHLNFYKGIREKASIKEDALFGMQARHWPTNKSYFEKKIINWDPEQAKII